jgi:hypothetical protein
MRWRGRRRVTLLAVLWAVIGRPVCAAGGGGEYIAPDAFVRQAFGGKPPLPALLWPSPALQHRMRAVLGHPYKALRIRYWRSGLRTAWVLDEVGKDEEITLGFVLEGEGAAAAIAYTDVLVFRESRGWEIRFPGFTKQFRGRRLAEGDTLDQPIDGITGATLSVGAYRRLARLALLLHREVMADSAREAEAR